MDYQFNKELGQAFESADFLSDDFENFGFDEFAEDNWSEEPSLSAAIRELDDSLGTIDFHQ
jgi:hypothetical protein